jgi:hypothetical protein
VKVLTGRCPRVQGVGGILARHAAAVELAGPVHTGALLDRQAGAFRLGPFGVNVPAARIYEPGTNTLLTTWTRSPAGSSCAMR